MCARAPHRPAASAADSATDVITALWLPAATVGMDAEATTKRLSTISVVARMHPPERELGDVV